MTTDSIPQISTLENLANAPPEQAHCRKCDKDKDIDEFSRNRNSPNGHSAICKACVKRLYSRPKPASPSPETQAEIPALPKEIDINIRLIFE